MAPRASSSTRFGLSELKDLPEAGRLAVPAEAQPSEPSIEPQAETAETPGTAETSTETAAS